MNEPEQRRYLYTQKEELGKYQEPVLTRTILLNFQSDVKEVWLLLPPRV